MTLSNVLALTFLGVLASVAEAKPKAKPLFVKVVTDLGLVDTIKGAEALTIFAPNDEAFAKEDLSSLTAEQKKAVVLRHVVVGKVMYADVVTGPVKTFGGEEIDLVKSRDRADPGEVRIEFSVNGSFRFAKVVKADVQACNGVIHVINRVILPSNDHAE